MAEETDWASGLASSAPPVPKEAREGAAKARTEAKVGTDVTGIPSRKRPMPVQYKYKESEVKELQRVESSLFTKGYARGTFNGIIGPPGTGKTRLMIQEVVSSSARGENSLYLYNEFIRPNFDVTINRIVKDMNFNDNDLEHVTWCDMSSYDLGVADYDSIKSHMKRWWVQQVQYWLDHLDGEPAFVVIDSFSAVCRRFIPQMWIAHADLLEGLADVYATRSVKPVTLLVHQKSQSYKEVNNDATVGGYGIVHELDATIVLRMRDVDRWDADRYGFKEGTMAHSVMVTKDRYGDPFEERMVHIDKGKMILGEKLDDLITKRRDAKLAEKSKKFGHRSAIEAVSPGEIWDSTNE